MPLLHVLRLALTGAVLLVSYYNSLSFSEFLMLYTVQVSVVYLLDLVFANFLIARAVKKYSAVV
jgi:hypothetical protein